MQQHARVKMTHLGQVPADLHAVHVSIHSVLEAADRQPAWMLTVCDRRQTGELSLQWVHHLLLMCEGHWHHHHSMKTTMKHAGLLPPSFPSS